MDDSDLQDVYQRGKLNQDVVRLASNYCRRMKIKRSPFSGVGLPEQWTGLPIAPREISCEFASRPTSGSTDAERTALAFYDANCVDCPHRVPGALPNLLELVDRRDRRAKEVERTTELANESAQAALDQRSAERAAIASVSDPTQAGLLDLIDRFDTSREDAEATALLGAAKATPARFSERMREHLLEMLGAKDSRGLGTILEALNLIEPDPRTVALAAVEVLKRDRARDVAVPLVAKHLDRLDFSEAAPALPSILTAAAPRDLGFYSVTRPTPQPLPLLAFYERWPTAVLETLIVKLRGGEPYWRGAVALAAIEIMRVDPPSLAKLSDALVRALLLPEPGIPLHRRLSRAAIVPTSGEGDRPASARVRRSVVLGPRPEPEAKDVPIHSVPPTAIA